MAKKAQAPKTTAPATEEKKGYVPGTETFEHEGKKYGILIHAVIIPGIGKLTAAEIALHEEAQKALVEMDVLDSVLSEIA